MHSSPCCQGGPFCGRRWLCIRPLWRQFGHEGDEWLLISLLGERRIQEGKGESERDPLRLRMEWEWEWDCGEECSGLLLLRTPRGSSEGRVCFSALLNCLSF